MTKRTTTLFVLAVLSALVLVFFVWSITRDIPFDRDRWQHPTFSWDRNRMRRSLLTYLDTNKPSRAATLELLDTPSEPHAHINAYPPTQDGSVLMFDLGNRPPTRFSLFGGRMSITIVFDQNGNYRNWVMNLP